MILTVFVRSQVTLYAWQEVKIKLLTYCIHAIIDVTKRQAPVFCHKLQSCMRERERERETETERERQTDRQTDRQRETETQTDRQACRDAGNQAGKQTDTHSGIKRVIISLVMKRLKVLMTYAIIIGSI